MNGPVVLISLLLLAPSSAAWMAGNVGRPAFETMFAGMVERMERRAFFQNALVTTTAFISPSLASAASFTAGGTLVDRPVGVQVGNPEASPSRRADNSNVIFDKDHYFKFGVAAPWIEPGSTDFPKSVPFTPTQQRYDALKKYGTRVQTAVRFLASLQDTVQTNPTALPDPATAPEYGFRPMGLLANSLLASENTGVTNELFLARWYVNEIFLNLQDARAASNASEAAKSYAKAKKATNSYLGLVNRVIKAKVGEPLELL